MRISDWSSDVCSSDLNSETRARVCRSRSGPRFRDQMRAHQASCLLSGDFRKMQFIDHSSLDMFPIMFLSSSLGSLHHESNLAESCIPAGLRFRGAIMVCSDMRVEGKEGVVKC